MVERRRICEVYTESARAGSGYLVADRLVLTAAHAVKAVGSAVQIRRLAGGSIRLNGRVAWTRYGERMDAALLEITDSRWTPPADLPPTRWGRLVTSEGNIPCAAVGYPKAQEVRKPDGTLELRDTEHLSGTIGPLGTSKTGFYPVSVTTAVPYPATPSEHPPSSGWAGMSGAAVLCGPLLTGVISQVADRFSGDRLSAVPLASMLDIPEFTALIAQATGTEPVAEPAELEPLASVVSPPQTPAALLRADVAAVRFRGRDELLDQLRTWCVTPGGFSVRLLTGPGGQGKTRLAAELGLRMAREKWAVLHLATATADGAADYSRLASLDCPALIVVDYAEAKNGQVAKLVEKLVQSPISARLLLLARSAGDWQRDLAASSPALALAGPDFSVEIPVPVLADTTDERAAMFEDAVADLATRLDSLPGYAAVGWDDARTRVQMPDLSLPRYGTALAVQMSALAALLTAGYPDGDSPVDQPEDVLLGHEQRYWLDLSVELGITLPDRGRVCRWLAAAGSLCTAADEDEALALATRLPGLGDRDELERRAAARLLHYLYGERNLYVGSLQPDVLAEYLIALVLADRPAVFDTVLANGSAEQARRGLTVLARAAVGRPYVAEVIGRLITSKPAALAPAAVTVATESENPAPLTDALDVLLDAGHLDHNVVEALDDAMPLYSQVHRDRAERVAGRLVAHYRDLDLAARPGWRSRLTPAGRRASPHSERLAAALHEHAHRLAETGRATDSLAAYRESIAIRRRLAKVAPAARQDQLAVAINDAALALSALGRHREALAASEEALAILGLPADTLPGLSVEIARALATMNRGKSLMELGQPEEARTATEDAIAQLRGLPDDPHALVSLAQATRNHAAILAIGGRPEEAVAAAREAVTAYRELADALPDWFEAELATALVNLSKTEFEAGAPVAALAAAQEAVEILHPLSVGHQAVFGPYLALALVNQGGLTRQLGRPADGLPSVEEAVALYRALNDSRPGVHTAQLVMALADLDVIENDLRHDGGGTLAGEAVDLARDLARGNPQAFDPTLHLALNTRARILAGSNRYTEALALAQEMVATSRRLAERLPDVHLTSLAEDLAGLAQLLTWLGRTEESYAAAKEAGTLCQRAASTWEAGRHSNLGAAFGALSAALTELGRHEEALAASIELVAFYRMRNGGDHTAFRAELAAALASLRCDLYELRRYEEALSAGQETAEIYRALATERSGAFEGDLADELAGVARALSMLGRKAEAVDPQREVVSLRRDLAQDGSHKQLERLARSLSTLAFRLDEAALPDEALSAKQESVMMFQGLADAGPETYGPLAATALTELAAYQMEMGDFGARAMSLAEAVPLLRRAVPTEPAKYKPDLADTLMDLSSTLGELGEFSEALATGREAEKLFRELTPDDPTAHRDELAALGVSVAAALLGLGQPDEALSAIQPVVAAMAPGDEASPAAVVLLIARRIMSIALAGLERVDDAIGAARECTRLARKVAGTDQDNWMRTRELAMALILEGRIQNLAGHDVDARALLEESAALLQSLGPDAPGPILALLAQVRDELAGLL
jgi:tetratricopeptide (TPR) repeat protein